MVNVKCPKCDSTEFDQDEEDPDYYTCCNCKCEIWVNTGGFLTPYEREILEQFKK